MQSFPFQTAIGHNIAFVLKRTDNGDISGVGRDVTKIIFFFFFLAGIKMLV